MHYLIVFSFLFKYIEAENKSCCNNSTETDQFFDEEWRISSIA